jgi:A/G-specific adenine glycosylase
VHELPPPRARKALPTRKATWFIYVHARQVLLERRPSRGLWGGLWSFPERRIFPSGRGTKLPPIEHGFTHFRLVAQPVVFKMQSAAGGMWLDIADAAAGAVPAPVRAVLRRL